MRILITNDDGINGVGMLALINVLKQKHTVFVCAPNIQRSSSSHSVQYVHRSLEVEERMIDGNVRAWSVDGMPADCTYVGLFLLENNVDLVISGINQGQNLSLDCHYSGTVGAAKESLIQGIPAMAVSLASNHDKDFEAACKVTEQLIPVYLGDPNCRNYVLNVNVPVGKPEDIKGIKCVPFDKEYKYRLTMVREEKDSDHFFVKLKDGELSGSSEGDFYWIRKGYVTCTPLGLDFSEPAYMHYFNKYLGRNS